MMNSVTLTETHTRLERLSFRSFGGKEKPAALVATPPSANAALLPQPPEPPQELVLEPPPPPPPPSYSEEELLRAKHAAYQEGFQAGQQTEEARHNKASEEANAATRALLEAVGNRITLASEQHGQWLKSQQQLMCNLTLAAARKVAGEALKREPHLPLEELLKSCTQLIAGEEVITITVSVPRYEGLRQALDTLKPLLRDFQGRIEILSDAALGEHDCSVEWKNGKATRSGTAIWAEIETLLRNTAFSYS